MMTNFPSDEASYEKAIRGVINMKDSKLSILRKYKRMSKSPFSGDDSTILLLADLEIVSDDASLKYQRYIYLHRDALGRWLGVSVSQSIENELADGEGKYRRDTQAISLLLQYHDQINKFLKHFSDEIEALFGIDSETWLIACKARWRKILR